MAWAAQAATWRVRRDERPPDPPFLAPPMVTILDALADPKLFGPFFEPAASWARWWAFLAALDGLPMTDAMLATYRAHTGRTAPPATPAREAWVIVGRRGGKSRIAAALTVYAAAFRRYRLAPGERGVAMVLAADRQQARVVFRYVAALFDECPLLRPLVAERTREALRLTTGVDIEIHTASFRAVRGYSIVSAVLDEVAYWPTDDAANPDAEIVAAIRPALLTTGGRLVAISSPYARRGELWRAYERHYGRDEDPVLVWQADTQSMHPTVDAADIAAAYAEDAARAAAEYGAQFRSDLEAFVPREVVDGCTVPGRVVLPPGADVTYVAFVDPSGGSADSFTLAIAHRETRDGGEEVCVVDAVYERRAPFNPSQVVAEYAALLAPYGITRVVGDHYAGEWPREAFGRHDITYEPAARPKADLYRDLLPWLTSRRVELPDDPRLRAQLCALERRTGRSGRDLIDHPPGGHDDVANAVAGAVAAASGPRARLFFGDEPDARAVAAPYLAQLREAMPEKFSWPSSLDDASLTCGDCDNFEARTGRCTARLLLVTRDLRACDAFIAAPE